jgi:thioredoxin
MKEIKSVEEFNELVRQDKPVLLDFYADWCGPCQALLPTIEKLAETHKEDMEIVKINIDKQGAIATKFGIRSIPTLLFVKDLTIKERLQGYQSENVLSKKIAQYI